MIALNRFLNMTVLGVAGFLSNGLAGCNPSHSDAPNAASRTRGLALQSARSASREGLPNDPAFETRLELEGDRRLGTVIFVRGLHSTLDDVIQEETAESQWLTLRYLEILRPQTVFVEGTSQDRDYAATQARIRQAVPPHVLVSLQPFFQNHLPAQPSLFELDFVAQIGGSNVYAYRHPDVMQRAASTREQYEVSRRYRLQYRSCLESGERDDVCRAGLENFIYGTREMWAVERMAEHLRRHPGETIALVFGGAHRFCQLFQERNFTPRMVSVWPRGIVQRIPPSCVRANRD